MIAVYRTSCSNCHAFYEVKYGRGSKNEIFEIFSCPHCKNLFSTSNMNKDATCPECGNKNLVPYNMNKSKNISYYKKMLREGLLTPKKYNTLVEYWQNMKSITCPQCGKDTLNWHIYSKL